MKAVESFDQTFDDLAEAMRSNPPLNRLFYSLSEAANHSMIWHALTWAGVGIGKRSVVDAARTSLAFGAESGIVNGVIKQLFKRERPVLEDRPHKLRQPKTSSFPSGHATSAFFALVVLGSRRNVALLLPLAILVSWSRVHVKIHHASDVVGGVFVGLALGLAARKTLRSLS